MKVSDAVTLPLCRGHHRQLHQTGDEVAWWANPKLEPLEVARGLWEQTHPQVAAAPVSQQGNTVTPVDTNGQVSKP